MPFIMKNREIAEHRRLLERSLIFKSQTQQKFRPKQYFLHWLKMLDSPIISSTASFKPLLFSSGQTAFHRLESSKDWQRAGRFSTC
jgi:hypothetical protein